MAAHAARIGPGIAFAHALVVLRRLQHQHALAVRQREGAHFLARKAVLDHDPGARLAEGALDHGGAHGGFGLLHGRSDGDALAGGEAVRLHHDRRAALADMGGGRIRVVEHRETGSGNAGAAREVLHEGLGAFQPRRRPVRPEYRDAVLPETVRQPGRQRRFRPDDDEVHALLPRQRRQALDILGGDRRAIGLGGDAGIARRAPEPLHQRGGRDRPDERMFAPAAAHHQNPHGLHALPIRVYLRQP